MHIHLSSIKYPRTQVCSLSLITLVFKIVHSTLKTVLKFNLRKCSFKNSLRQFAFKCDHLSKHLACSYTFQCFIFSALSAISKEFINKISAFCGKIIDLYSDYTENKLQELTFIAITSVCISLQYCNFA